MKKKILISLLIVIVILIISTTFIFLTNKDKKEIPSIYGTWESLKIVSIRNNEKTSERDWIDYTIQILEDKTMFLCYGKNINKECSTTNYTYSQKNLNIEDNERYLKGNYEVSFEGSNILILKYTYAEGQEDKMYFKKIES